MPRSKDPRNYGQFFQNLLMYMQGHPPRIELRSIPGTQAVHLRNSFYSFTNAWRSEAERPHKGLEKEEKARRIAQALEFEELLRSYKATIYLAGRKIQNASAVTAESVDLIFTHRAQVDDHADASAQLLQQINDSGILNRRPAELAPSHTVVASKLRSEDSPVKHLFETPPPPRPETPEDIAELQAAERDARGELDLSDLIPTDVTVDGRSTDQITPDYQAASPNPHLEFLKNADTLRNKEKDSQ